MGNFCLGYIPLSCCGVVFGLYIALWFILCILSLSSLMYIGVRVVLPHLAGAHHTIVTFTC